MGFSLLPDTNPALVSLIKGKGETGGLKGKNMRERGKRLGYKIEGDEKGKRGE